MPSSAVNRGTSQVPDAQPTIPGKNQGNLRAVELFAGAGGLALGIGKGGFVCRGLIERDTSAVRTLRKNAAVLGTTAESVFEADAAKFDFHQYEGIDLLAGGPPCQPFSAGGKNLGSDDPRNMFPAFFRAAGQSFPRAVMIENVRGLTRPKFADYFRYIIKQLEFPAMLPRDGEDWRIHYSRLTKVDSANLPDCEQYEVAFQHIDAADFGAPQRRERIIITAFRRDTGLLPVKLAATHSRESLMYDQHVSGAYWKDHNLPTLELADGEPAWTKAQKKALEERPCQSKRWQTVRDAIADLPQPAQRGITTSTPPNHIQHPGARAYPGHTGSDLDKPAKALKAGAHGTPGGENTVKVGLAGEVRYFTIREAARLQTFPDAWNFEGSWGACIRQLGNAVPVEVAQQFAAEIHRRLLTLAGEHA